MTHRVAALNHTNVELDKRRTMPRREASRTPPAFARLLVDLAASAARTETA